VAPAPLRIALLGCGTLAEILADRVYPAAAEAVQVVAAIDVRPERARHIAQRLGARAYGSLEEACREGDVEAVDIRLPHHLHLLGAQASADVGVAFLVEKPMATSLRAAGEIEALARSVSVSCGVGENYAHLAPVRAASELVAAGTIGELLTVRATRVFDLGQEWRRDGWRLGAGEGAGGVVVDQATHMARLVRTVVGEPAEVFAYTPGGPTGSGGGPSSARPRASGARSGSARQIVSGEGSGSAGPDTAVVAMRFASGIIGTQTYCWTSRAPAGPDGNTELELYGTDGSIVVHVSYDGPGGGALLRRPGAEDEWHGTGTSYYDSLTAVLVDWARAVRAGREPGCSMREGVRDVAVMEATIMSAARGAPVAVPVAGEGGTFD
jgi:predicted dehydrogenase